MAAANALIHEKSPYLRQHAYNPVQWLPWGEEAFTRARAESKPIFLSIGYSTCHWCHVMAHESFEDDRVASVLNANFVPIKLDREERPDIDRIYMLFVQASTGSGGWPMSVWLTPELRPFFGGTYFPPDSRYGRPGFLDLLKHLAAAWSSERERIESSSSNVIEQLRDLSTTSSPAVADINQDQFAAGFWYFRRTYDSRWGGFGQAPKFPRPVIFNYLLRYFAETNNSEALDMVTGTLRAMARGGMHDHLGGGFHRYSVDERWFVPHFEKMLYDQAQLAYSYLEAHQVTGEESFAEVARGMFAYLERDMTSPSGGFFSAEDADSPDPARPDHSREGAFYVWTQDEIESVLTPEEAASFCAAYGVKKDGNVDEDPHGEFRGRNILYRTSPPDAANEKSFDLPKQKLLRERSRRPRPHLDDKVLTSWNSLTISAWVKGFLVLGEASYLHVAEHTAAFLLSNMYDPASGRLLRRFYHGEAGIPAFLDDYAFFAQALLDLFEATGKASYLATSIDLAQRGFSWFEDPGEGGFFSTQAGSPDIVLRMKEDYDGAEPSGNSAATDVLLRLAHLTANPDFQKRAERSLRAFAPKLTAQPAIAPQMSIAVGRWLAKPEQIVIRCAEFSPEAQQLLREHRESAKEADARLDSIQESTESLRGALDPPSVLRGFRKTFRPRAAVFALTDESARALQNTAPFLANLERKGRLTIYVCRDFACELPQVIE
jgi:uncharacterized protein